LRKILIFLLSCFPGWLSASGSVSGTIRNASSGNPLAGAHVIVIKSKQGAFSDSSGSFVLTGIAPGTWQISASFLGYQTETRTVRFEDNSIVAIHFRLIPSTLSVNEVEITGKKIDKEILNTPMRMERISQEVLANNPGVSVTDALDYISGVNTSSTTGIFDNSTVVSMRGLSGNDQGRTLVLVDGFPVNKSDEGTVNWHLINRENIADIMITKGPGPARYGSNAMGGVIDIRSRKPEKKFGGLVTAEYGTFDTWGIRYYLDGKLGPADKEQGFLYNLNGFYRQSRGYNPEIPEYMEPGDSFTTDTRLREAKIGAMTGYQFNKNHLTEVTVSFYNDIRGRGVQIYEIDGAYEKHDTYHLTARYTGNHKSWQWKVAGYWLTERFSRLNEYMNEGEYNLYKVLSLREDKGATCDLSIQTGKYNTLEAGFEFRQGSVDGQDIYYTSTDLITNSGVMETYALYIQDALTLIRGKANLVLGLRLNTAVFHDGSFNAEYPSYAVQYLQDYQDTLIPTHTWFDADPNISFQYRFGAENRIYVSVAKGFRAPNLDDLCRTGKKRGGFKIANPGLKPENLYNMETGTDLTFFRSFHISPSLYYSIGADFMYYVTTGDSVNLGYKLDPVYQKRNISRVDIAGADLDFEYSPIPAISLFANYSFTHSVITRFTPTDAVKENDLQGKFLTDVPAHKASAGCTWINPYVNVNVLWKYVGSRWINDENLEDPYLGYAKYPARNTFSFKLKKIQESPGRIITGELTFKF
jgi:iron complex outermembrane receptor protein